MLRKFPLTDNIKWIWVKNEQVSVVLQLGLSKESLQKSYLLKLSRFTCFGDKLKGRV